MRSETSARLFSTLIDFQRISVENSLADVSERIVHRMRERMNHRRLMLAGDHDARAFVLLQVANDRVDRQVGLRRGWRSRLTRREWTFVAQHRLRNSRLV